MSLIIDATLSQIGRSVLSTSLDDDLGRVGDPRTVRPCSDLEEIGSDEIKTFARPF